jgi:murein DD-endopeptidase MepM/ murein hydrolase activator NlpD
LLALGFAVAVAFVPATGARSDGVSGRVPQLVFPLVAKTELWDNYGDPRGNGRHAGIDMENPWRAPVVAVESGRVEYATSNLGGCMLYLYGRSGTMYMYIHLNNDRTPRNDGKGGCVEGGAYAVPNGANVLVGEQIAFNGDSGDASGNPHLHFEVHPGGGEDVSPFPHLKKALRPLFAGKQGALFSLGLRGRLQVAEAGTLRIAATAVRAYPGGRWLPIDEREVELAVPPASAAEEQLASSFNQRLVATKTAPRVAVFTAKAKVTREALVGVPRSLDALRISQLP